MTWTAIFINNKGDISHKRFVSSHTGKIAWDEICAFDEASDVRLVCIIPGDHVPQSYAGRE